MGSGLCAGHEGWSKIARQLRLVQALLGRQMESSSAVFPLDKPELLGQDTYVMKLAEWVLENPDDSGVVQKKIIENSGHISLTGYGTLWHMLGSQEGWGDTLWIGISSRKHPTQDCIDLVKKNTHVLSMADMYGWLHEKMIQRSQPSALFLSQHLSLEAASHALLGVWVGADLLMRRILGQYGQREIMVEGRYNWWEAAAIILDEKLEKHTVSNNAVIRSGMLKGPVLSYISMLEENDHLATQDRVGCGQVFARAVELNEYTYLPLLNAWVQAGGDWKTLSHTASGKAREVLARHPVVRRERLMETLSARLPVEQEQQREI